MIEQLFSDIYKLEIPLPNNPLKATNSYFIRGKERNLLIDTGFNRPECQEEMDKAIREIGFSMHNTDLFLTHVHSDHTGLAGNLAGVGTKVYAGDYCAQILMGSKSGIQTYYKEFVIESGLSEMGVSPFNPSIHPGLKYASGKVSRVKVLRDEDILEVGDVALRCLETTGHAPDHLCLYEAQRKILFSGDHILGKITPNNTIWGTPWRISYDYLGAYLQNLDKIVSLNIEVVLPGHRAIFNDCYKRIDELKKHHQRRLNSILDILGTKDKMNGAEVASKMTWDLNLKSWEEFPPAQKFFATGEALSHLTHLVFKKILIKELYNGVVYYSLNHH